VDYGRGYPQILNRWKYIDFRPSFWIPRQISASLIDYGHVPDDGYRCGSDIEKETTDDLIHFYTFPPYTGSAIAQTKMWFNGSNDLDIRGFYTDTTDNKGNRLLTRAWTEYWPTCGAWTSDQFEHLDYLIEPPDLNIVQCNEYTAVYWHDYPMRQVWVPEKFPRIPSRRTAHLAEHLSSSNEERFCEAIFQADLCIQIRGRRLSGKG
jgi:hypothetical protein